MIDKRTAKQLIEKHGSLRKAAKASGHSYWSLQNAVTGMLVKRAPSVAERTGKTTIATNTPATTRRDTGETRIKAKRTLKAKLPARGKVHYHLFTCAQNNTKVHPTFWNNLVAFKDWLGGTLHVSRITYKKKAYNAQPTKEKLYGTEDMWWDERVVPFIDDSRTEIAPGLVWCGDVDILPTAERPLQGLETFTGRRSGIFPHVKIALDSIPSNKNEATKFNYTTGAVTMRNYIQRKVGQKAEFHHCYAALLVEVDDAGNWFCRQINADSSGTFYDLDVCARAGEVDPGHRVAAIYWGDGHRDEQDPEAAELAFGPGGIKSSLRPEKDFIGDVITLVSQNHHNKKDPHVQAILRHRKERDTKKNVLQGGSFLDEIVVEPDCETYAVYGNHERWLGRWLKDPQSHAFDVENAEFAAELQAATFAFIREHKSEPNYFELALRVAGWEAPDHLHFLMEDESVIVCPDANGGIECGAYHGDRGPNGSRGTARGLSKTGRKICIGDKHAAQIIDGVYVAGTFSKLDLDWVHGPSNWSHSHVVVYPNGKRAIVTCWNGKWRA